MKIASSWSGGKDSCYALMQAIQNGHQLSVLLNMMNENNHISRSHGISKNLLQAQANALGVDIKAIPASWEDYEAKYIDSLHELKSDYNIEAVVYGDIDLEPHREWEEKVCQKADLKALLPLWQQNRKALVFEMIEEGLEVIIVSCNDQMGSHYLGKKITKTLIEELESNGIDPCGENGEYHTIVVNCPLFKSTISLPEYTKVNHNNYWFLQWS